MDVDRFDSANFFDRAGSQSPSVISTEALWTNTETPAGWSPKHIPQIAEPTPEFQLPRQRTPAPPTHACDQCSASQQLAPCATQITVAHVICKDQQDVWLLSRNQRTRQKKNNEEWKTVHVDQANVTLPWR